MDTILHHLRELLRERSRVALVILGVVWGTLSLTLLVAFGSEMGSASRQTIDNMGHSLLRVGNGTATREWRGMPVGRWIDRVEEDAAVVLAAVPGIEDAAVECLAGGGNPLERDGVRMNVSVAGAGANFGDLRHQLPQPGGRFLNERDVTEHRSVIFLGDRTAARLFGSEDPVGGEVMLRNRPFTVIGVRRPLVNASSYSGDDRDKVCIPVSTFRDQYGWTTISNLWLRFRERGASPASRQPVIDEVFAALAARSSIHPEDRDAIWMMDYVEIEEWIGGLTGGLRYFMVGVGVIGLLVALVGVANVTFVMVEERTREIGVEMALGARPRDLAFARLAQSVLVCLIGGACGVLAAAGILALFNQVPLETDARAYLGHPSVSFPLGAIVAAVLALGGGLAGWVPARRAARLNPVEALRES